MTVREQGLQAFQQGRLNEAADRLRDAASEREHAVSQEARFQTLCYLGAAQYALGRPREAVTAFEEAVRFSPLPLPPAGLLVNLANACLAVGRPEDGRLVLQKVLRLTPGNQEAHMLLRRLDRHLSENSPTGSVLGEHPDGVRRYLETLSFSRTADGGLEPDQVHLAIAQVGRYLDHLAGQVTARDDAIARLEEELAWERQKPNTSGDTQKTRQLGLTPVEILFQKKP